MPTKLIVAHNLAELRKSKGLTQGEMAEIFNYSDKSISKWEHGETLPDIEVLKEICDYFGVTLDYLVTENKDEQKSLKKKQRTANKWVIVALSVTTVFLFAVVAYFVGQIAMGDDVWPKYGWMCYMWAVPVALIVMLIFNSIWGKALWRAILVTSITWTMLIGIYITVGLFVHDGLGWTLWPLFIIGVPLTVAAILWNHVLSPKEKSK